MPLWTTDDTIIQFLNEIRRRPELWDVDNVIYKDREAKRHSWALVGAMFDVTADEAYAKFRNLRTYARNEQKKNKKKVTWFAYEAISFIFSPNTQNLSNEGESYGRVSGIDLSGYDQNECSRSSMEAFPVSVSYKKAKKNKDQETQTSESPKISNDDEGRNFYSAFGEHIANKMNTYDRYTRSQVEFRISKILFDADMGLFDESSNWQVSPIDSQNAQTIMDMHIKTEEV